VKPASNCAPSRNRRPRETSLGHIVPRTVVARPDEPLRVLFSAWRRRVLRGCQSSRTTAENWWELISLDDLLLARVRNLNEERSSGTASAIALPFRSQREPEREWRRIIACDGLMRSCLFNTRAPAR